MRLSSGNFVRPKSGGSIMKVDRVVSLEQPRSIGRERKATTPTKKFIPKRITRASIFTMPFGGVLFAFTGMPPFVLTAIEKVPDLRNRYSPSTTSRRRIVGPTLDALAFQPKPDHSSVSSR